MSETIADLRGHLFKTLRGLTDKDNPMDIERAKAVSEVAQTIINSAKVEVEAIKMVGGGTGSGFIPIEAKTKTKSGSTVIEDRPGVTVTRHKLA